MRPFLQLLVIALVLSAICDQTEAFKKKKFKLPLFKNGASDNDCAESARPCQSQQLAAQPVYQTQVVQPQVVQRPAPVRAVAPVVAPAVAASPAVAKVKVPKKAVKKVVKKAVKKAPKIKKLLKKLAKLAKFGGPGGKQEENCEEESSQPRYLERRLAKQPAQREAVRPFGMPNEQKTSY